MAAGALVPGKDYDEETGEVLENGRPVDDRRTTGKRPEDENCVLPAIQSKAALSSGLLPELSCDPEAPPGPEQIQINGRTYCTKNLTRYDRPDMAEPIKATTLTSLIEAHNLRHI